MGICNWVAWWHHGGDVHSAEQTARDLSEFAVAMIAQPGGRTQEVSGPRAAIRMIREDLQYLESMLDGGNESV
jgi:hypothetical protein